MQDVLATLLGASLVTGGFLLKYIFDKPKLTTAKETYTNMTFAGELLCGHVETVATGEDEPWSYLLEPCENPAIVTMGGQSMCEDHRDTYLLDMSKSG